MNDNETGGACSTHGRQENFIQIFNRKKPEGMRPHERPRCRWEDNIKMENAYIE
jgi:hypothetical protein